MKTTTKTDSLLTVILNTHSYINAASCTNSNTDPNSNPSANPDTTTNTNSYTEKILIIIRTAIPIPFECQN